MSTLRRFLPVLAIVPGLVLLPAAPVRADDNSGGGQDNTAVAINTEDGASVFRLAFSVRRVADGVVDQTNGAYALASCVECQTIALAFQVVLALGEVDVAVPENRAVAYNDECLECVTYASATQIVLGFDGPVRITAEGLRRLVELRRVLRGLEERAPALTVAELNAEVQAVKAELVAILEQEVVEVTARPADADQDPPDGDSTTSTTTTPPDPAGTTTTSAPESSTTTTHSPTTSSSATTSSTSTTTTTAESSSTTTSTSEPTSPAGDDTTGAG